MEGGGGGNPAVKSDDVAPPPPPPPTPPGPLPPGCLFDAIQSYTNYVYGRARVCDAGDESVMSSSWTVQIRDAMRCVMFWSSRREKTVYDPYATPVT